MWHLPTLNFSKKKKKLEQLVKAFPESKIGLQAFHTNRQSNRTGFGQAFTNILSEEFDMLSKRLEKNTKRTEQERKTQLKKLNSEKQENAVFAFFDQCSISRHVQLAKYTVVHIESDVDVKHTQILQP